MKARQVYGLRPFSLAVTALIRSSAGLRSTQSRFHLVSKPCFTAVPSCSALHSSLQSACTPDIEAHESYDASGGSGVGVGTGTLTSKFDLVNPWRPYELTVYIIGYVSYPRMPVSFGLSLEA